LNLLLITVCTYSTGRLNPWSLCPAYIYIYIYLAFSLLTRMYFPHSLFSTTSSSPFIVCFNIVFPSQPFPFIFVFFVSGHVLEHEPYWNNEIPYCGSLMNMCSCWPNKITQNAKWSTPHKFDIIQCHGDRFMSVVAKHSNSGRHRSLMHYTIFRRAKNRTRNGESWRDERSLLIISNLCN
jgi:hypothetical protein